LHVAAPAADGSATTEATMTTATANAVTARPDRFRRAGAGDGMIVIAASSWTCGDHDNSNRL
jgi:hypothetical protein